MKDLHTLPDLTEHALGGLQADEQMKQRILEKSRNHIPSRSFRPVMAYAVCTALVIAVLCTAVLNQTREPEMPMITSQPAGVQNASSSGSFRQSGSTGVNVGVRQVSSGMSSIWEASETAGIFPLVGIRGDYYRLLTAEASSGITLGQPIDTVEEFTTEPSLSGLDIVVSNYLPTGTQLYSIPSMGTSVIACSLDNQVRLFQRVSFNGYGIRNSDTLDSTLCCSGHIVSMELSDTGIIYDRNTCEDLYQTLIKNSMLTSSGNLTPQASLIIRLDNGLSLQMNCRGDRLSACGVWSCPEFFEQFQQLLNP